KEPGEVRARALHGGVRALGASGGDGGLRRAVPRPADALPRLPGRPRAPPSRSGRGRARARRRRDGARSGAAPRDAVGPGGVMERHLDLPSETLKRALAVLASAPQTLRKRSRAY